jgi:FAD/FMN-containing dehydrogenase
MDLLDALSRAVGAPHVLTEPDIRASYERDWTGRFDGRALAVVRPSSTAQVADVIRACAAHRAAVIPQGGNTGLAGGGVPRAERPGGREQIVLSLARLREIGPVDIGADQVTTDAGATLAELQACARAAGREVTIDIAARDTCTIGGLVACDAGGARALRHGTVRAHVAGLEAVMADGSVITRLGGLAKDNAGYDLPALLIGSEGTLGVITRVRWRLGPRLGSRVAALIGLDSPGQAAALLAALREWAPAMESCDFFTDEGLALVLAHQRRPSPVRQRAPFYVLVECASRYDPTMELAAALDLAGIGDRARGEVLIADDTASRERLWALRDGHADAINAAGVPHKLDVGVPIGRLEEFLARLPQAVTDASGGCGRVIPFGHLGDGNVHVNVLGTDPADEAVDDAVLALALACGGTISAEHGIGVVKARWLARARGHADLAAMRAIKRALDPEGMLNPGVVLELDPAS